MFDFSGKVVVVTGGARGIGKCICDTFREAGAVVCVIDLLENDYFVGDLADKATLEEFAKKVISDYGHVDYLINNAAPKFCGITNGSYEDFEYALKVGVTAPFYLSKLFAPHFAKGASIVNISSVWGQTGGSCEVAYSAAKAGLIGFTKALAKELAPSGITVNCVAPGCVESRMLADLDRDALKEMIPTGKLCSGLDVAKCVLFLAEQEQITGQVLAPNGGMYI